MRFVRWLGFLVLCLAQPAYAQAPVSQQTFEQRLATITQAPRQAPTSLQSLERRLANLANENPGDYGFAVLDLTTGQSAGYNANVPFPMASTMKVAVAATYLADVDAGRRSLDDRVAGMSAASLMDAMITRSDNRATDLLLEMLGGPSTVHDWLRGHGIRGMRVDRNIAELLAARRDLRDIRDSSTPNAMLSLLRLIDSGNALRPQSRFMLLDMMARCRTGRNRMRALLPSDVQVEHKTGTLSGYTSDVGFLTLPGGRRIAVAFFARGGENRPAVIATAARSIYEAFAGPDRNSFPGSGNQNGILAVSHGGR